MIKKTTKSYRDLVPPELLEVDLPLITLRKLGCRFCDWRGSSLCDYGVKAGSGTKFQAYKEGICEKRKYFVLSCYDGPVGRITHKGLLRGYRHWTLNQTYLNDLSELNRLDDRIGTLVDLLLEDGADISREDELKVCREERIRLHDSMCNLGLNLNKLDNSDLDRESREKLVDKTLEKMSLTQIHKIMRGDVVEGDYKEKGD